MSFPNATLEVKKVLDSAILLSRSQGKTLGYWHILQVILFYPLKLSVTPILEEFFNNDMGEKIFESRARNIPTGFPGNFPNLSKIKKITQILSAVRFQVRSQERMYITLMDLFIYIVRTDEVSKRLSEYIDVDLLVVRLTEEIAKLADDRQDTTLTSPLFTRYGEDLTQMARDGQLDPVIGREKETGRIISTLCRRRKNNPILVGASGCGKSAIIEGLAQRIIDGSVPEVLRNKKVISIDMASIVAGTQFRGQFEERLKAIINELREDSDIILFIDEIHNIVGAGSSQGAMDASNILKAPLSRGVIQCIGATTPEEYRKYIEKDKALERRFQKVIIEEPSDKETLEILHGLRDTYGRFHNVEISDNLLSLCIRLSNRYRFDRAQPDKAIDILDEASADLRLDSNLVPDDILQIEDQLKYLRSRKDQLVLDDRLEEACSVKADIGRLESDLRVEKTKWLQSTRNQGAKLTEDYLYRITARLSGIPEDKVTIEESEKILHMEEELRKRVIGQDAAIASLARSLRISKSGLQDRKKPIGVFFFLGPSGVGKTHVSKELAKYLFGSEKALIKENMSEMGERHSGSRLIGAPPGYVGYDEGGSLINKVREQPYSVILLDEFEKADPQVHNLLLQVFDEGELKDGKGKSADMRNTIIIMTSNIGSRIITGDYKEVGFRTDRNGLQKYRVMEKKLKDELKKRFAPEFLNRISEVIVFDDLSKDQLAQIVPLLIEEMSEESDQFSFEITEAAARKIVELGYEEKMGARPLRRAIDEHIKASLAQKILEDQFSEGDTVVIGLKKAKPLSSKDEFSFARKHRRRSTRGIKEESRREEHGTV